MILKVAKSELKPRLLQYLRKVEKTGHPIVITDRGRATAKIIPFPDKTKDHLQDLKGSVSYYKDPFEPVGLEDWELA